LSVHRDCPRWVNCGRKNDTVDDRQGRGTGHRPGGLDTFDAGRADKGIRLGDETAESHLFGILRSGGSFCRGRCAFGFQEDGLSGRRRNGISHCNSRRTDDIGYSCSRNSNGL
jgi:hypothetical protein